MSMKSSVPHPVRIRRFMNGLSQDALAQKAGVCRSEISRLESGFHVSRRVLCMVAGALGSSPEALGKDGQK